MGSTKNETSVANNPPAPRVSHTKLTMSLLTSGVADIFSVYLPSVSKSTTDTCKLISTSAATYAMAESLSSRSVAPAKYATAAAPKSDAPNM